MHKSTLDELSAPRKIRFMNVWSTLDAVVKPSRHMPWPELETPFTSVTPKNGVPVLFAFPHSGRRYPDSFKTISTLDAQQLRTSEDAWVDEMFEAAPQFGASLLIAHFPRAMVDVNRGANELDPAMYEDHCPVQYGQRSSRVLAGLGVIPRIVSADMPIYSGKIPYAFAVQCLHHLHAPWHKTLLKLLQCQKQHSGSTLLIDCHSMPSSCAAHCPGGEADFVLGDGYGQTCRPDLIAHVEHVLITMGYKVVRNTPYSGGYSTLRYGKPERGFEALQIEINRALYMDEKRLKKTRGFARLRKDMRTLSKSICAFVGV